MSERLNQAFCNRGYPNGQKAYKSYLTSVLRQEMPIKITMKSYLHPPEWLKLEGQQGKVLTGYWATRTLTLHWWDCQLVQLFWKAIWQSRLQLSYDYRRTQQSLFQVYSQKKRACPPRDLCEKVHSSLTQNSQKIGNNSNVHQQWNG